VELTMERRQQARVQSGAFVAIMIASMVLVNLLAVKVLRAHWFRKDLTARQLYTLSQGTNRVLGSHDYYNRFEVAVGRFGEEGFEVVERADLSQRVLRGSPVTVSFILGGASNRPGSLGTTSGGRSSSASSAPRSTETTPPTRTAGAGTASYSATSFAQRDVQARHGAPDKVDSLDLPYGREVTWWYFEKGRAFRFLEGELSEELTFTPVED
jgi:hypothetical protein